ncbi:MAG: 50S ribosomal protein L30e [Sulfolobaceae archaeon]|jgi:LSU ribosomal protein L30E
MSESIGFEGELRTLLRTGKVILGTKRTLKMLKLGKVKGIIIASTLRQDLKDDLIHYAKLAGIPYYEYKGSALELGTLCGKPFIVSAIGVIDEGESKIFQNK